MTIKDLINLSMKTSDGFKMSEKSIIESFFKKKKKIMDFYQSLIFRSFQRLKAK